ncbi:outer membrane protein TOM13 [Glarea lozoyensis ATCC 20868]|uniref:Outer membrane protein TOM13 n=1 Tax=Glarea lozoyensis (strain ATCC 20868 / MF5171) TaxID=1116229 RepID=S3CS56_GLAL2|nr:outer membrane protein TOM13 [Glarea lozoyensis ATCC 20868]EPE27899.1 outer membrane protein TOM13 [Glarea lozoyensis ATCC 20868]
MASEDLLNPMTESSLTIPSDSEQYSGNDELSPSPPSSSSSPPMILYQPPSLWGLVRGAAINLLLPFINGMMLGFGELFAHEAAFRLGWGGTKVFPSGRSSHSVGPGIEIRENPFEARRRDGQLDDLTSME